MMAEFTDQLQAATSSLWQKSQDHPFVKELASGELPLKKFRFYLLQDRYYLDEFTKFHQLIAATAEDQQIADFVRARAQDLRDTEIKVREQFFQELAITSEEVLKTPIAPTAYAYVNHLYQSLARDGLGAGVAAIVPCYWLYQEIGKSLADTDSPVTYYQEWIDTYEDDWYQVNVAKVLALTNQLADQATEDERQGMRDAFIRSSYYELQFWQMAYEEEGWN
ncbi:thiaminase II [Lactobacillus xylocopicola]|uniref:Aminopyrimidine aminohydrolase n=1 Tax=Lactobacillus xylocopicola TaxID=2976676 RepID=A0ABM8BIN2_9LACO|nr:thiaminase II [Lactobacillus xylocopicola]BDR61148.1 aminopyrimidine aminohydrolase [Lactobacillus xylocopicola]